MQIAVQFVATEEHAHLEQSRREYLDSLPHGQQLLIELIAGVSRWYAISRRGELCGHLIVSADDVLIEFHLSRPYWVFGEFVVGRAIRELRIRKAWVKSFDALFFSSVVSHQTALRPKALLIRDFVERDLPDIPRIQFESRRADVDDIESIRRIESEIFSDPERLRSVVERGQVTMFEADGKPMAFGITRPVLTGNDDVDVSIAVSREYQRRGHAAYILRHLIQSCLERGQNPVAGCPVQNLASRHVGERVGFVALHRLLELDLLQAD